MNPRHIVYMYPDIESKEALPIRDLNYMKLPGLMQLLITINYYGIVL